MGFVCVQVRVHLLECVLSDWLDEAARTALYCGVVEIGVSESVSVRTSVGVCECECGTVETTLLLVTGRQIHVMTYLKYGVSAFCPLV